MYMKKNGKYSTLAVFDLCSVVSMCAFISSDIVLNNENSMKIKQLANPFQSTCTPCNLHKLFKGSFFKFFWEPDEEVFDLEWLRTLM